MVQGRCPHSSKRKLCFDAADTSSTFLSLTVCKRESELPGLLQADVSGWDLITVLFPCTRAGARFGGTLKPRPTSVCSDGSHYSAGQSGLSCLWSWGLAVGVTRVRELLSEALVVTVV